MNNPMEPIETMDPVKKRKQSSRSGPLSDDAKRCNLEKLPSSCLQRILSFVPYDQVAQLRQVSKVFNVTALNTLYKGQKELEGLLEKEIERAERRKAQFSINVRSSNDTLRFLKGLFHAINNCTKTYWIFKEYFVAGKLLDDVFCLLNDFDSSTAVPYFVESVREQKPHPLLGPISAHSVKAVAHFETKIKPNCPLARRGFLLRFRQIDLDLDALREHYEKKIMETDLLENLRLKMDCGNELSKQLFILILKLNEKVMDLIQRAKKLDDVLDKDHNNCLYQCSSLSLGETKLMGIRDQKRPNLATLPPSCLQNVISHFNCDQMAQLRAVCKSFNEGCKKGLNEEFEKTNQILQFKKEIREKYNFHSVLREDDLKVNLLKDICSFLHLCEDNYKRYLGSNYYFAAGRVLDEAKRIYIKLFQDYDMYHNNDEFALYYDYKSQPHWYLFPLMDMAYKSIAHFKFTIVPKHFLSTQKPTHVPDDVITGEMLSFEEESQLKLEEIERLVKETKVKIKEQNDRNRKFQNVVSGLKKKVLVLNQEISEKNNVLKKLE